MKYLAAISIALAVSCSGADKTPDHKAVEKGFLSLKSAIIDENFELLHSLLSARARSEWLYRLMNSSDQKAGEFIRSLDSQNDQIVSDWYVYNYKYAGTEMEKLRPLPDQVLALPEMKTLFQRDYNIARDEIRRGMIGLEATNVEVSGGSATILATAGNGSAVLYTFTMDMQGWKVDSYFPAPKKLR